jgi:hypothetical protein
MLQGLRNIKHMLLIIFQSHMCLGFRVSVVEFLQSPVAHARLEIWRLL